QPKFPQEQQLLLPLQQPKPQQQQQPRPPNQDSQKQQLLDAANSRTQAAIREFREFDEVWQPKAAVTSENIDDRIRQAEARAQETEQRRDDVLRAVAAARDPAGWAGSLDQILKQTPDVYVNQRAAFLQSYVPKSAYNVIVAAGIVEDEQGHWMVAVSS